MHPEIRPGDRIAVVGAGAAGITCAHLLQRRYAVTLVDAAPRLGGHANPVVVATPEGEVRVDTGFLVFNTATYPDFLRLLGELGVSEAIAPTDMRFSMTSARGGLAFSDRDLFALADGGRNLLRPRALRLFADLLRLRRRAWRALRAGEPLPGTIAEACAPYSPALFEDLIRPLGSAIWTLPGEEIARYPAAAFFAFFDHHGLLRGPSGRRWRTLAGSSGAYLDAFRARFSGELRLRAPAARVERGEAGVTVHVDGQPPVEAEAVVLATHADKALSLLGDPTPEEARLLSPWRYHQSRAVLHTDPRLMPPRRHLWASWNVIDDGAGPVVTYDLRRVQALPTAAPLFLSLADRPIDAAHVLGAFDYRHPIFDAASVATWPGLRGMRGARRTFFAGSYFGYGFHQDAVASGVAVARALGCSWGDGSGGDR